MNKILSILIALLLIPGVMSAQQPQQTQQTELDRLLQDYDTKQRIAVYPKDTESENRKLKNEMIDLRVENDALNEQITYLQAKIDQNVMGDGIDVWEECDVIQCVPTSKVMKEKIVTYVIYSLGMYRLAEIIDQVAPQENVEAHTKAQKIMVDVKADLNVLGFDTSDMTRVPKLEELLRQLAVTHNVAPAQ